MKLPALSDRVFLAVVATAALSLRVAGLGRNDFWADEVHTIEALGGDTWTLVAERLRAGHVPLYFLLLDAWTAVFGTSQTSVRMPSALLGAAAVFPAFALFRRLVPATAARWATACLAFHPLLVELSREARMYPLLALVFLVAAWRAAAALDGERPGAWFWGALLVGPLVHPTWGFGCAALLAWLLHERRRGGDAAPARLATAGLIASLAVLTVALGAAATQHQELVRRVWWREAGVFVLRLIAGTELRALGLLQWIAYAALWAMALVVGVLTARPRARRFALWLAFGVPAASVVVGLAGGVPWGPARYVQFAAVGVSLLAGAAPGRPIRKALFVSLLALVAVAQQFAPGRTSWSDAAVALRETSEPVVVEDEHQRRVLRHYLGRDVHVVEPPPGADAWWTARLDAAGRERPVRLERRTR